MFNVVAVCCSVLQCVAVCCSVLQCVAVCSTWLSHIELNGFTCDIELNELKCECVLERSRMIASRSRCMFTALNLWFSAIELNGF